MLKKLVSVQESFYHKIDDRFEILADFLLKEIENLGMLPPFTLKQTETKGTLNNKVGVMYTNELVNEWDDEDPEPNYGEP